MLTHPLHGAWRRRLSVGSNRWRSLARNRGRFVDRMERDCSLQILEWIVLVHTGRLLRSFLQCLNRVGVRWAAPSSGPGASPPPPPSSAIGRPGWTMDARSGLPGCRGSAVGPMAPGTPIRLVLRYGISLKNRVRPLLASAKADDPCCWSLRKVTPSQSRRPRSPHRPTDRRHTHATHCLDGTEALLIYAAPPGVCARGIEHKCGDSRFQLRRER